MTKTRVMFSAVCAFIVACFLALGLTGCGTPGTYVSTVNNMSIYVEGASPVGDGSDPTSVLVTNDKGNSFLIETEYMGALPNSDFDTIHNQYKNQLETVVDNGSTIVMRESSTNWGLHMDSYVIAHRTDNRVTEAYSVDIYGMTTDVPDLNFSF